MGNASITLPIPKEISDELLRREIWRLPGCGRTADYDAWTGYSPGNTPCTFRRKTSRPFHYARYRHGQHRVGASVSAGHRRATGKFGCRLHHLEVRWGRLPGIYRSAQPDCYVPGTRTTRSNDTRRTGQAAR